MTGSISVACKMPNGLKLRVFKPIQEFDDVVGGGKRPATIWKPYGDAVEIKGNAVPREQEKYFPTEYGFAITSNIDKDFWDVWLEQNKESDIVKNKIIFAFEKKADIQVESKKLESVRSGFEPLNKDKDHRVAAIGRVSKKTDE